MKTSITVLVRRAAGCGVVLFFGIVASGCVTSAFNKCTSGGKWLPSLPQQIWVFQTTNPPPQLAVAFEQHFVGDRKPPCRPALWCPSQTNGSVMVDAGQIGQFTNTWISATSVPIYTSAADVPSAPSVAPTCYALLGTTNSQFTLHGSDLSPGPYTLPVTIVKPRTVLRLIGTPIALATDAAIGAAIVAGPIVAPFDGTSSISFR
jgi:hypothetical protein